MSKWRPTPDKMKRNIYLSFGVGIYKNSHVSSCLLHKSRLSTWNICWLLASLFVSAGTWYTAVPFIILESNSVSSCFLQTPTMFLQGFPETNQCPLRRRCHQGASFAQTPQLVDCIASSLSLVKHCVHIFKLMMVISKAQISVQKLSHFARQINPYT